MSEKHLLDRRQFIAGAATVAGALTLPIEAVARTATSSSHVVDSGPKLVLVPTAEDIQKALTTSSKGISEATHKAHLTLWQGYANKTNEIRKALAELDTDPAKGNQIYSQTRALKVNYAFAYGGYKNHNVYFDTIGGPGGPATGDVATLINDAYGSFEKWAADFKITGLSGRGWAFLAYDRDEQRVVNFIGDSQDTFPAWNTDLILALDVYEHAYYLDFHTARAKYIDAWFSAIDWNAVNARLGKAKGVS
jgi:Fe-Mn family superoxide dismutase